MDAEHPRNDCGECAQLRQELQALREQVAKLTAALEEERLRGKRRTAPFSKGPPVAEPKPSGRKSGRRHGPHAHRSVPPRTDAAYDAPLPKACPHCASQQISETHVAVQYQTEIPRPVTLQRGFFRGLSVKMLGAGENALTWIWSGYGKSVSPRTASPAARNKWENQTVFNASVKRCGRARPLE